MTYSPIHARELAARLSEAGADRALSIGDAWNLIDDAAIELRAALAEIERLEQERRIIAAQTTDKWAHDALRSRYVGGHEVSDAKD